ncbi:transposase domain-containing protein, partial [Acinetobacter indicus]
MSLSEHLESTLEHALPSLSHFCELIDLNWIETSLHQTGKASIRRRKLPAEHVVWLVLGLALFRNQPISYVVEQLKLVFGTTDYCVPSAAVQARQRLGREPLAALFSLISQA